MEVTLLWEYRSSITEGEDSSQDKYLSVYQGKEIKITKALLKDSQENIGGEVRKKMTEHIVKEYGCEVEFIE